jgi:hypothetical protein
VIDQILGWACVPLLLIGAVILLAALYTRPHGPHCRCPGPRAGALGLLSIGPYLRRCRCWYNLTGLEPDDAGRVRCPECGTITASNRLRADGRRVRLSPFGLLFLLLGSAAFATPWIRSGRWTTAVPTLPLVVVSRMDVADGRNDVTREIDRRVANGAVTGWSASLLARSLADQLRDDEIHWNAERAEDLLISLWPTSRPALESALESDDVQARIFAARVLRRRCIVPSDALLRACVADLGDDSDSADFYIRLGNARSAATYLVQWARRAAPFIGDGMRSDDPQRRLLAAAVAGNAGLIEHAGVAVPILVEHLRDNDSDGDAKVAAPALYRFGPDILPHLRPHADIDDDQARAMIRAIIERLEHPDRPIDQLGNPMPRITQDTHDPLTDLPLGSCAGQIDIRD